jgi:hypothetical protein
MQIEMMAINDECQPKALKVVILRMPLALHDGIITHHDKA